MRRTFGVFLLCLSVGLLAVAPSPKATPKPLPSLSPEPSATVSSNAPKVMIYPFETPTDVNPQTGQAIAQIYAQVLVQSGGVTVLAIPKDIRREDYGKYAHSQGADYYISGYVQPIGNGAAIISSVADVNNDVSVYSQTTQIESVPEVASQALNARTIILRNAGIDRPDIVTTRATPTPSSTEGTSVSISNVLGDLFKGHAKGKATPTPEPASKKPQRGVIVARLIGNAQPADLTRGTEALTSAMNETFNVTTPNINGVNLAHQADSICGTKRDNTIASGVLNVADTGGRFRHKNTYTFRLDVYTCFGSVLYTTTQTDDDLAKAIRDAVDAYVKEHPQNS